MCIGDCFPSYEWAGAACFHKSMGTLNKEWFLVPKGLWVSVLSRVMKEIICHSSRPLTGMGFKAWKMKPETTASSGGCSQSVRALGKCLNAPGTEFPGCSRHHQEWEWGRKSEVRGTERRHCRERARNGAAPGAQGPNSPSTNQRPLMAAHVEVPWEKDHRNSAQNEGILHLRAGSQGEVQKQNY